LSLRFQGIASLEIEILAGGQPECMHMNEKLLEMQVSHTSQSAWRQPHNACLEPSMPGRNVGGTESWLFIMAAL